MIFMGRAFSTPPLALLWRSGGVGNRPQTAVFHKQQGLHKLQTVVWFLCRRGLVSMSGTLVALYRVSTGEQGRSGLGLEGQREAVEKFAAAEGMVVVAEFVEIESGKGADALERRPVLVEALAAARKAKATLAVAKLCRLSRDVSFVSRLMAERVPFLVTELGREVDAFVLHLHAALAERERLVISQRTKAALRAKARALALEGKRLGNPTNLLEAGLIGAQRQREAAEGHAARIMPTIRELLGAGLTTTRAIADELNRRRIPTARGGEWHRSTVSNLLARAKETA